MKSIEFAYLTDIIINRIISLATYTEYTDSAFKDPRYIIITSSDIIKQNFKYLFPRLEAINIDNKDIGFIKLIISRGIDYRVALLLQIYFKCTDLDIEHIRSNKLHVIPYVDNIAAIKLKDFSVFIDENYLKNNFLLRNHNKIVMQESLIKNVDDKYNILHRSNLEIYNLFKSINNCIDNRIDKV